MTNKELEVSLQAYLRRRPFRPFLVEFFSGTQVQVDYPDAIVSVNRVWHYRGRRKAQALFPSSSVCRLLDAPTES